ncbi:MAG TPA: enoyl-CoA hydratase-related protein [Pirellulales bacterium]|jgi:3-hydroxypropionyl-coenzyme A dehydratase
MSESFIQTRVEGALLFVTINRPQKRNALTPQMMVDLAEAVRSADDHPEVRVVIVSGEGNIFSAGIDLMALGESRGDSTLNLGRWTRRFAEKLQQTLNAIEATEAPVIGALQGKVMGMGLELVLAFDLRVATEDLLLSMPEARLGLVADVGGTTRLTRTIGPARAKDMLLTAREVGALEALEWGLVNRVVPGADLMTETVALANQITQNAPQALGMAKRIVDQGDGLDKHTQMALERWAQSQLLATNDVQEAVLAFMEKRPPKFTGN